MIRLFYWFIVLLELFLLFAVLVLFIVTDSRTVTFLARQTLPSTKFTYKSINGNLFEGLKVRELSYNNHKLFTKATLHWNPISLLYNKVSLTRVEVDGLELDSVIGMVQELEKDSKSSSEFSLHYTLSLSNIHIDINPYIYEGIKLSSFLLESKGVDIGKDLTIDSEGLNLAFNSDIVNVKLDGKIEKSRLLLNSVDLKNISSTSITKLVKRLLKEKKSKKSSIEVKENPTVLFAPFKDIRVKHLLGTLKPVTYGNIVFQRATLNIYNVVIDPYKSYEYRAKKLYLKAQTNFGNIYYKGSIKKSTIYAKGEIRLKKRLFKKYNLPLNYKGLKRLSSSFKLNHHGVWVEIDHSLKKLLFPNNYFNIDIKKAHHKISYIYAKNLEIESRVDGSNSYAKKMKIDVKTIVDFKKVNITYDGNMTLDELQKLPDIVSDYLLTNLKGKFKGDLKGVKLGVTSELLKGDLELKNYKSLKVNLVTKKRNILLGKLFPFVNKSYRNETLDLNATALFPFKKIEDSKISLDIGSSLGNLNAKTVLKKPYQIVFNVYLPKNSKLKDIDKKIKFSRLSNLFGKVTLNKNQLKVELNNKKRLSIKFNYNIQKSQLSKAEIFLDELAIFLSSNSSNTIRLETHIANLQRSLNILQQYYNFEAPDIRGAVDIVLTKNSKQKVSCHIKSKHIKYLSSFNIYNINSDFTIDKDLNIVLNRYRFNIDKNEYIYKFFAKKNSYLSFRNGNLNIKKLWINDTILINGNYELKKKKGVIFVKATPYHFINKNFDLLLNVNIKAKILGDRFDVSGNVDILGNSIKYELPTAGIIDDSDIIIVQDKKNIEAPFQNLKLYLKINSSKPLLYKGDNAEVSFLNEISIVKNYKQHMLITGMSTIKDGYYDLEDKHFTLDESYLYFAGDARKPLLDIKANYVKGQYTIHIFISGTSEEPIVNFNSDPYLTQQEILSLILFDETGTSNGKGTEAYTLLGGTFAKDLMKSLGINIDHFILGTDEKDQLSLEVGGKVSKNISLIYLNRDGANGAEVRVEHGKHFETDIIVMPPNTSSIEFLYKNDH